MNTDARNASVCEELRPVSIRTSRGNVDTVVWGEGPAVLSLHGAMGGYDQGILLAKTAVSPRCRFIAISRPGYLGTALAAGPTAEEQADLCAEVLDRLGVEKTAVIAISGGGPAAVQFALRHPQRCAGLVMISACSQRLDVPVPFRWQVMKLMARIPAISGSMRKRVAADPGKAAQRAIPDSAWRERVLRDPETAALFMGLQSSVLDRMTARIAGTDNDIRQTRSAMSWPLERIAAPTLVIHGTRDGAVPYEQAVRLAARVGAAQLLTIEGGEHVSLFTHRYEIRERMDRFLESLDLQSLTTDRIETVAVHA
jgi:pimeloyl-ACP methyl ester carboxylesterase